MRQVNFTLIFVICLALVLFAIENTQLVSINIIKGIQITAPLSIELIIALGIGAVLAWVFSVWTALQDLFLTREALQQKEVQIEALQVNIERYKAELEEQQRLLPSVSSANRQTNTGSGSSTPTPSMDISKAMVIDDPASEPNIDREEP
ncbi:MAG: DUF1049 domain-containing protein [Acaryochloridaceae cyanobacterium SU_2_1]|nr:DUF1049 domain-containing protein [Acaryochloridaceae cyanobacterium SU_2_1]